MEHSHIDFEAIQPAYSAEKVRKLFDHASYLHDGLPARITRDLDLRKKI